MVREIVKKKTKRFERCGGAERSLQQQHHNNNPDQLEKCEVVCAGERESERERERERRGREWKQGTHSFHSSCCRRLMLLLLLTHSP
jgi:hypothetical protein